MAEQSTDPSAQKPQRKPAKQPKIGIALGAGGAKGIAHIPLLEALDELGVTPHRISGSSIGAVIGSLYASGLSAREIKDKVARLAITKHDTVHTVLSHRKIGKWMEMIDVDFRHSGLLKSASIMTGLYEDGSISTFEELAIPLTVVATDFWERRAVVNVTRHPTRRLLSMDCPGKPPRLLQEYAAGLDPLFTFAGSAHTQNRPHESPTTPFRPPTGPGGHHLGFIRAFRVPAIVARFRPLQKAYEREKAQLDKKDRAQIVEFAKIYDNLTAQAAADIGRRFFDLERARLAFQEKYLQLITEAVLPVIEVQSVQLQRRFDAQLETERMKYSPLVE